MSRDDAFVERVAAGPGGSAGGASRRTVLDRRRELVARHPWMFVAGAAVAGATLGAVARAWMRWISVDHEFSWSGTLAIVVGFTVFAGAQACAAVARIRSTRRATTAAVRATAALLSGGLFGAAGAVMLPTVVFGSIATWRTGLRRVVRLLLGVLALPSVVFVVIGIVEDHGWTFETIAQLLVFASIYAVVVAATWPTAAPVDDGWRPSRRVVVVVVAATIAFLGLALFLGGVQ